MSIGPIRFTEMLNRDINKALGGGLTTTQVAAALTTASTNVTALSNVTHSRAIQDHGPALNPTQPRTGQ